MNRSVWDKYKVSSWIKQQRIRNLSTEFPSVNPGRKLITGHCGLDTPRVI